MKRKDSGWDQNLSTSEIGRHRYFVDSNDSKHIIFTRKCYSIYGTQGFFFFNSFGSLVITETYDVNLK